MCGLVLVWNTTKLGLTTKNQKVFNDALFMTALRGMDSTGVFCLGRDGEEGWLVKDAYPSPLFLGSKEYDMLDSWGTSDGRAMFGHCRAATRGTVSDETAHPYHHGHIVLAHNGTLPTHADLTDKHFTVDSEAICYALSQKPWEEVLPEIHGAFALMWYDFKRKVMCVASNGERPLYQAYTSSGDMYITSEFEMLLTAASRQKETLYQDDKGFRFFPFPKNTVLEIPFDFVGDCKELEYTEFKENKKSFTQGKVATTPHTMARLALITGDRTTNKSHKKEVKKQKKISRSSFQDSNTGEVPDTVWFEVEAVTHIGPKSQKVWGSGKDTDGNHYITCLLCAKSNDYKVGDLWQGTPYIRYTSHVNAEEFIQVDGLTHYMVNGCVLLQEAGEAFTCDGDGNEVTREEWEKLPSSVTSCAVCTSPVLFNDLPLSLTTRQNNHIDCVICPCCANLNI